MGIWYIHPCSVSREQLAMSEDSNCRGAIHCALRRALVQRNLQAWEWVQRSYRETLLNWLHSHPSREAACRLAGEDYYVSQAFERLWQATADNQKLAYMQSTALLKYLHTSLNSALLDALREPSPEKGLPQSGAYIPGALTVKDLND